MLYIIYILCIYPIPGPPPESPRDHQFWWFLMVSGAFLAVSGAFCVCFCSFVFASVVSQCSFQFCCVVFGFLFGSCGSCRAGSNGFWWFRVFPLGFTQTPKMTIIGGLPVPIPIPMPVPIPFPVPIPIPIPIPIFLFIPIPTLFFLFLFLFRFLFLFLFLLLFLFPCSCSHFYACSFSDSYSSSYCPLDTCSIKKARWRVGRRQLDKYGKEKFPIVGILCNAGDLRLSLL